eukprot:1004874_1
MEFIFSEKCKEIKCIEEDDKLHFGIQKGARLSEKHLQALLLYTDFTDFCTHLSATFRASYFNEDIKLIKKRNSMFFHISKALRELIQYFGISGQDDEYGDGYSPNGTETGAFYCGMSCELVIPEFAIRLKGPSSTTKQIEIAMRFSGSGGIILQLNNISWTGKQESFFDTSWISCFPEEDERIMVGGRWKLEIESVRVMTTKNNYETFVKSFHFLDKMVSGECYGIGENLSSENIEIVKKCVSNYLNLATNNFHKYIKDTFWLFCKKK